MAKNSVQKSFLQSLGYGQLLVPPLIIIMIISLSFVYVQSRTNSKITNVANGTTSEPQIVSVKPMASLPLTDLSTLPVIEPNVMLSDQSDNSVTNSTSPQPSGKESLSKLQSNSPSNQLQSRNYGTPNDIKQMLNSLPSLKVEAFKGGQIDFSR